MGATRKPNVFVVSTSKLPCELLGYAATLSNSTSIKQTDSSNKELPQCAKCVMNAETSIYIEISGLVNVEAEMKKLTKKIGKLEKDVKRLHSKINNPKYIEKVTQEVQ